MDCSYLQQKYSCLQEMSIEECTVETKISGIFFEIILSGGKLVAMVVRSWTGKMAQWRSKQETQGQSLAPQGHPVLMEKKTLQVQNRKSLPALSSVVPKENTSERNNWLL